jgi:hypothetical protein
MQVNQLRSPEDYELFLYTITEQFPVVYRSTVTFIRVGATLARVAGELFLDGSVRIVVRERLVYNRLPLTIEWYGYEVWKDEEKLYWYDSQPHPNDLALQSSYPHHKHIAPDIKHNRIPAPEMSFSQPNIPVLIENASKYINVK